MKLKQTHSLTLQERSSSICLSLFLSSVPSYFPLLPSFPPLSPDSSHSTSLPIPRFDSNCVPSAEKRKKTHSCTSKVPECRIGGKRRKNSVQKVVPTIKDRQTRTCRQSMTERERWERPEKEGLEGRRFLPSSGTDKRLHIFERTVHTHTTKHIVLGERHYVECMP